MNAINSNRISLALAGGRRFWSHLKILRVKLEALMDVIVIANGDTTDYPESEPEGYMMLSMAALHSCEELIKETRCSREMNSDSLQECLNIGPLLWTKESSQFITLIVKHSYLVLENIEDKYYPHSLYTWNEMVTGRTLEHCLNYFSHNRFLQSDIVHLLEQLVLLKTALCVR